MAFDFVPVQIEIDIKGFHSVYYFEFDTNFYHPPEKHDFWEMVYVDYGRINAIVEGVNCTLSKGQVIFHYPMESHTHFSNEESAGNVVVVAFSCHSPAMSFFNKKIFSLEKASQKILSQFLSEASDALGGICEDFENKSPIDFSKAKPGSVQMMQCYLVEFLFSLIRTNEVSIMFLLPPPNTCQIAENFLVDSILLFITNNLSQPPSLATLCANFSISPAYLSRIFKESVGSSPVDFWISMKIKEAKKLIRENNQNITQISEHLGYTSIHHFSRMFKRFTGLSPTAYKASIRARN